MLQGCARWCFVSHERRASFFQVSFISIGVSSLSSFAFLAVSSASVNSVARSRPPFFLPRSKMHSIACGRGSGGSRYVDMVVTIDSGDSQKELDFTNIHRDELRVLNEYIHGVLIPAMTKDANGGNGEEESSPSNSDGNNSPTSAASSGESPSSSNQRSSKRKASKAAREATRAELSPSQDTESEEEEEGDDGGWDSTEDDDSISDGDMSLTGVNDVPVDDSDTEEDEEARDDDVEKSNSEGIATESDENDDDSEPQNKKARRE